METNHPTMKHIFKFIMASIVLLFVFVPIIVARWVWTFKFDDTFPKMPRGVFYAYKVSFRNLGRRIQGKPVFQTF